MPPNSKFSLALVIQLLNDHVTKAEAGHMGTFPAENDFSSGKAVNPC